MHLLSSLPLSFSLFRFLAPEDAEEEGGGGGGRGVWVIILGVLCEGLPPGSPGPDHILDLNT